MTIQERIKDDTIKTMSNNTPELLSFLRVIAGEFPRCEFYKTHKLTDPLPDEEVIKILRGMVKNAKTMKNEYEVKVLETYLPQMLDQGDILLIITKIIIDNGITDVKEMGKVMGLLKQHPQASLIDNKFASAAVRLQLSKVV